MGLDAGSGSPYVVTDLWPVRRADMLKTILFQPILDKCHTILDRLIRAKVPQYVAEIVVARKIRPALTYAASVASH